MEFRILKSFARDLKKIKEKKLLTKVKKVTEEVKETIENIENQDEIPFKVKNAKKITGTKNSYRIKVDDSYRIGAEVDNEQEETTQKIKKKFSLKRFLHRKDIYDKFP